MKMIIQGGPVYSNIKILLFTTKSQPDATISIKNNEELVNKILEQVSNYNISEICFTSSPVWANGIIKLLKSKDIEDLSKNEIKYTIIYQERKRS